MVFLVDEQGVPSVASIVQVPVPSGDVSPPSAPGGLVATGQLGGVRLNWSASTDDVGVTGYRVHRSTSSGFTPSPANQVANLGGSVTSYTDSGLAAGTYHYVVVAADAAGNSSPPSAQATGTALADTTAPTRVGDRAGRRFVAVRGGSVTATASDDVGVARVQFRLDGQNLGAPDTSAPFEHSWDTRSASNGAHSLTRGRDGRGRERDDLDGGPGQRQQPGRQRRPGRRLRLRGGRRQLDRRRDRDGPPGHALGRRLVDRRPQRQSALLRRRQRLGHGRRRQRPRPDHRHDDRGLGLPHHHQQHLAHRHRQRTNRRTRLRTVLHVPDGTPSRHRLHGRRAVGDRHGALARERLDPSRGYL